MGNKVKIIIEIDVDKVNTNGLTPKYIESIIWGDVLAEHFQDSAEECKQCDGCEEYADGMQCPFGIFSTRIAIPCVICNNLNDELSCNKNCKKPVIAQFDSDADEMNKKYGERYGVDWIYAKDLKGHTK